MRTLLLALTISAAALPAAAQDVKSGIDAWQKGDAAGAVAIWRPLAEQGDADAAFNIGQSYRLGKGVPLDLGQAQNWLERAARKGHTDAAATLGLLLFQNGNRVTAMRWLRQAAEAGEPRALLLIGTALYNGDGIASDPVTAYAYVSRSAAQGLAQAKATLADMDQIMPLDQRQKGLALAKKLAAVRTSGIAGAQPKALTKPKAPAKSTPSKLAVALAPPIAPAPAAASGAWRIQLGAFSQRSSAQTLFSKMSTKLGGLQAYYIPAGAVVRLQAGPFRTRADASAACARLAPQPCFAVVAR